MIPHRFVFPSPVGPLGIETDEENVLRVVIGTDWCSDPIPSAIALRAKAEFDRYFSRELREFTVPFLVKGTPFQKSVLQALRDIPYGMTASYRDIAVRIGLPKAARAVGTVCAKNDLPILIPCHRILRSDGSLGGYAFGTERKAGLLRLERGICVR